ncbi:MAG: sigma factor-like helix-turn-helix DNA-binding protein [bacterium]|nr:sigma factor-like helix-turn-helix DNA-binding protein [bacterium]
MIPFSPRAVSKDLLSELPERSRHVLVERFGLGPKGISRTLDSIGKEYGITRERIRQIENHGVSLVRESSKYAEHSAELNDLKSALHSLGALLSNETILSEIAGEKDRNHVVFILTVGHQFTDRRESNDFHARWHTDEQLADQVERALMNLAESIDADRLTPEEEFMQIFAKALRQEGIKNRPTDVLTRWLVISKRIGRNPLGEWGRADSPHVRIKNTRDFAYLTLRRHGSPMHFTEVAKSIKNLFSRDANPATTHNELIKDNRFVLVGRGLYALKEWGYQPGVVRDVIKLILEREGALTREEIIDRVRRERYVKDATISANLQNSIFVRLPDGRHSLVK